MRPITEAYSSGEASRIDGKCEYDQQPAGDSGRRFALYAEDLTLLCDKEASYSGGMDIWGAHPPRIIAVYAMVEKTDVRIQSSRTICPPIPGLSLDMGCPSRMEASSSPCHQRCLRLRSYKMWWMKAVKHQLYGICQGLPHNHSLYPWRSLEPPSGVKTNTWSSRQGSRLKTRHNRNTIV